MKIDVLISAFGDITKTTKDVYVYKVQDVFQVLIQFKDLNLVYPTIYFASKNLHDCLVKIAELNIPFYDVVFSENFGSADIEKYKCYFVK